MKPIEELREALDSHGRESRLEGGFSHDATPDRANRAMERAEAAKVILLAALSELASAREELARLKAIIADAETLPLTEWAQELAARKENADALAIALTEKDAENQRLRGAAESMRERAAKVVADDAQSTRSPIPKTLLAEIRALPLTTETKESR